jgi:hypothetical protein
MKKLLVTVIFFLAMSLVAQEIQLRVIKTSPYYNFVDNQYVGELQPGELISAKQNCWYGNVMHGIPRTLNFYFHMDNKEYFTYAKNLASPDTETLFGDDIFIDFGEFPFSYSDSIGRKIDFVGGSPKEMWIPAYYCDVLRSKYRETLTEYEPFLLQYNTGKYTPEFDDYEYWYNQVYDHITQGMYLFFNSVIFGDNNDIIFIVQNIVKTDYGYGVTCLGPKTVNLEDGPNFDWSLYPGGLVTLFLNVDGEYLDMYMGDTGHKFGTMVRVKEEFIRQYQRLIETNECDLTKVIWPCRADGSTDSPVESPVAENQEEFPVEAEPVPVAALPVPSEQAVPSAEPEPAAPVAAVESRSLPWIAIAGALAACGIMAAVVLRRKRRKAGGGSAGQGA